MAEQAPEHIRQIYNSVELIKKVSDRVVGIGPFGIGLDGLLTWIPGAGGIYSVGAGGFLLVQALRARAHPWTLLRMLGYLAVDTASSEILIIGDVIDFFFPGHLMAAKALQKDMEKRHGPLAAPKGEAKARKVGTSSVAQAAPAARR